MIGCHLILYENEISNMADTNKAEKLAAARKKVKYPPYQFKYVLCPLKR
jgi:hypothetical protein